MKDQQPEINLKYFKEALAREKEKTEKFEKIVNYNNLQQLSWLREGLRRAQNVGRIFTPSGLGTGWLITDELLLTNNHVIDTQPKPLSTWAEFNYELDWQGNPAPVDRYEIDELVKTDKDLDYAILKVKGRPGEKYGYTNILNARRPRLDSSAKRYPVIIQHPRGDYKHISLTDNHLVAMDQNYIWYTTDTEPGSSGSPVYDQLWRPFALHHAGGPKRLDDGRVVLLNEGIILSVIISDAHDVLGVTKSVQPLVSDLLSSGVFDPGARDLDLDWYMSNQQLHKAIKNDAQGDKELACLIAAAAGVAAGIASAYWDRVRKEEALVEAMSFEFTSSYKEDVPHIDKLSQVELFDKLYKKLTSEEEGKKYLAEIGPKRPEHEFLPFAAAFLAGLVGGRKIYDKAVKR